MINRGNPRPMSRDEVRSVDRRAVEEFGMPSIILMENAGRGAAELLTELGIDGDVVVCAGKGNNGGDGFVIARHLENYGYSVRVVLLCKPSELQGDAAINYRILERSAADLHVCDATDGVEKLGAELAGADWIVDALLGTGVKGSIREPYLTAIKSINSAGAQVLAVDLPSGLGCDTGEPLGASVRADYTATFVARKLGFDAVGAEAMTGVVHVIDIGVPRVLLQSI